jgi:molecular chaperone HtpG
MKIPQRFEKIIKSNYTLYSIVLDVISSVVPIYKDNKLYFFEEYTDHGIDHIENVLESEEFIISENSFMHLDGNEVFVLILATLIHDIGMHIDLSFFNLLIKGSYDAYRIDEIDDKTWSELWLEYLSEVKRFSTTQKINIFGKESVPFKIPDLSNKDNLTGYDKKLIGEFIRRNHGRIAQEIILNGLRGEKVTIELGAIKIDEKVKQLVGILARSHNMDIRDTFNYLRKIGHDSWRNPHGVNIIFLMVVIRIADYIQIDKTRVNALLLKLKTFNSPISKLENDTHLAINSINYNQIDNERLYVDCSPENSVMFVKIKKLLTDIQKELDISWAILGEIYGFIPKNKPSIKFRRISSNLENKTYLGNLNYVPEQVSFKMDNNLSKLLVRPLYGENPKFAVRELLQNSIDACNERRMIDKLNYTPLIDVSIERLDKDFNLFIINDNGKGMVQNEIINYFLNVGASYRNSLDWKKRFIDEQGNTKVNKIGKFGIGVLASFLLGEKIEVRTKSILDNVTYSFSANIDSQFINIETSENNEDYGTTIKITLNNYVREKLLFNTEDSLTEIKWNEWYLYDDIQINYWIDNKKIDVKSIISNVSFFDFSTPEFDNIKWSYLIVNGCPHLVHLFAINGMLISKRYLGFFNESEDTRQVIYEKPSILLSDNNGLFPLKLNRTEIDCDFFPFETELLIETSKHFIAQLLNIRVNNRRLERIELYHSSHIIYGANGFIIDADYFINGVKDSFNLVRVFPHRLDLRIDLSNYQKFLFDIEVGYFHIFDNDRIDVSIIRLMNSCRRLLLSKRLNSLGLLSKTIFANEPAKLLDESNNHVLFSLEQNPFNYESLFLNNIQEIESDFLNQVYCVQDALYEDYNREGGEILDDLFSKYIKKNYIIPYDINKRKEIYREAFDDLKYYMKK